MQTKADQLRKLTEQYAPALKSLPEDSMAARPAPGKWSKKEIIGHLVDSAQNNIRRFLVAQYEDCPTIVYDQDRWVAHANYQQWDTRDLVDLWYLLNKQVSAILMNTSTEMAQRKCRTQEVHTIKWMVDDYLNHLCHHIHQVLELEPVAYP